MTDELTPSKLAKLTVDEALQQVSEWAIKRPRWMSAALIALIDHELDDGDIERFADLAFAEAGGDVTQPFITLAELQSTSPTLPAVTLRHIENVTNVNFLAPGETLAFGEFGVSVVYGPNGSGKSGYTRILKQVCRFRGGALPLLPNIFDSSAGPSSADIGWRVSGTETVESWVIGAEGDQLLRQINVFDSNAAAAAVKDAAAAPFVPFPVRLLEALGDVIQRVRTLLSEREISDRSSLQDIPGVGENSELRSTIEMIGCGLSASDFIDRFALNNEEDVELEGLIRDHAQRKLLNIMDETLTIDRLLSDLDALETGFAQVEKHLDPAALVKSSAAGTRMSSAKANAKLGLELLVGNELEGIGTDQWKALWEKAREFSNTFVYPEHVYPHVSDNATCVLCNQLLAGRAGERMINLEKFVADSAQLDLEVEKDAHASWVAETTSDFLAASAQPSSNLLAVATELNIDLKTLTKDAVEAATELLRLHTRIRNGEAVLNELEGSEAEGQPESTSWIHDGANTAFAALRDHLDAKKQSLADSQDQEKEEVSFKRRAALQERKTAAGAVVVLGAREKMSSSIAQCGAAQALCSTRAATELSGKLSEGLITEALRRALAEELTLLGADRLTVSIVKDTSKAVSKFRLQLTAASSTSSVGEVLSEGETRVLSLAAFLMEVRLSGGASAIILDDPVSSLDHLFREKVASRIAMESTRRQVIVFTHDLVFLDELAEASRLAGQPAKVSAIKSTTRGSGIVSANLPAAGGDLKTQLAHIDARIARSKATWESGDADLWDPVSRGIAGDLRTVWERGVEEALFSKVVTRFRANVMTQSLRGVHVPDELWTEIERAMSELSGKGPHDAATAQVRNAMTYAELLAATKRLREWKSLVESKRKETELRRGNLIPRARS